MKILPALTQNPTFRMRIAPLIISLTLLFSIVIIAVTPPATGYELSIYEAYPTFLWVLISINIFFCMYTIIRSGDSQSGNLYYGYFSVLLIETIIVFLPIIRGYYSMSRGGGDVFYHMFFASKILNSGYVYVTDIYPIMHIWLSILHNFIPDFIILTITTSTVFFILYILSLYMLGKTITGTKKGGIFVSIFGTPLIFSYGHYAFFPFLFALFMFPLIFYSYQKIKNNSAQKGPFYICLIILSLFIVFCHPMISVFLIIMFSIFTFHELYIGWATARQPNIEAANIVIIISITLFVWWLQFASLLRTIEKVSYAFLGQRSETTIIDHQLGAIATADISIWQVMDRFIKIFGPPSLYFLIAFFFLLYLIYLYYHNKKIDANYLIYSLQFCVAICIGVAMIIGFFVIAEPIRALMLGIVFATILCGLFFYRVEFSTVSKKRQLILSASIALLVTLVCMLTMLTLYSSPWTSLPNTALTYGEKNGNDWILDYRNAKIPVVSEMGSLKKYSFYHYEALDQNLFEYIMIIPSNFGYKTNRTIGDSLAYLPDKNVYMITPEMMKLTRYAVPVDRRNRLKSFTDSDFIRLKNDPSVNLVYLSNEMGVWNIDIPEKPVNKSLVRQSIRQTLSNLTPATTIPGELVKQENGS